MIDLNKAKEIAKVLTNIASNKIFIMTGSSVLSMLGHISRESKDFDFTVQVKDDLEMDSLIYKFKEHFQKFHLSNSRVNKIGYDKDDMLIQFILDGEKVDLFFKTRKINTILIEGIVTEVAWDIWEEKKKVRDKFHSDLTELFQTIDKVSMYYKPL